MPVNESHASWMYTGSFGSTVPVLKGCNRPILLKKSVCPNCLIIDWRKRLFCTLLREIRVRKPLPKVKISISDAYFSDAQTMADFFNTIDPLQTFITSRLSRGYAGPKRSQIIGWNSLLDAATRTIHRTFREFSGLEALRLYTHRPGFPLEIELHLLLPSPGNKFVIQIFLH